MFRALAGRALVAVVPRTDVLGSLCAQQDNPFNIQPGLGGIREPCVRDLDRGRARLVW